MSKTNRIHLDADEVRREARGRWESILSSLASGFDPALQRVGKHVDCPMPSHGGKNDFRFFKDVAETGGAICSCGKWGDGFALLMAKNGWSFPDALQEVGSYLGLTDQKEREERAKRRNDPREQERLAKERAEKEAKRKKDDQTLRRGLNEVWSNSVAIDHPQAEPARLYLARRGLKVRNLPQTLRCHPYLPYYEEGEKIGVFPALVAMVQAPDGAPVTLHRIYLTDEGFKAPVPSPKKLMAYPSDRTLRGAAIRLGPLTKERTLGVAEGIETALAVQQGSDEMPVWATISASILENFEPPSEVVLLCIWADKDRSEAGQKAAKELKKKVGIQAVGLLPGEPIPENKKSIDWLDIVAKYGFSGIYSLKSIKQLIKKAG
ncbi:DUF7146 domain-containing protein [Geoalkalibacter subterraneus]|uniref:DUF7146 domain-containing protein n=1 Tax=Geoalkalibacter subterraneus TaxID=483547 RepID=UPI0006940721|nr:toprim domain-containing protein [Geoalkalibacter subterraneus]